MKYAIEIRGLCKDYGDFQLDHVDLLVPGGTIMGLIGENGAGKSTVIRCMLGLTRPDGGEISLLELSPEEAKQEIGVVLDEGNLHDVLKAPQVGSILSRIYQNWDGELFESYLDKFQLPRNKRLKEFSKGMKMKLAIACALAHRPKLLILDEATVGLDPVVRSEMLEEFMDFIQDESHAILISSHITSDLERLADYVTYLHHGRVVVQGGKDDLLDRYGRLICSAADFERVDQADLVGVRRSQFSCEALVKDRRDFQRRHPGLTVDRVGLEDIMVFTVKGEEA